MEPVLGPCLIPGCSLHCQLFVSSQTGFNCQMCTHQRGSHKLLGYLLNNVFYPYSDVPPGNVNVPPNRGPGTSSTTEGPTAHRLAHVLAQDNPSTTKSERLQLFNQKTRNSNTDNTNNNNTHNNNTHNTNNNNTNNNSNKKRKSPFISSKSPTPSLVNLYFCPVGSRVPGTDAEVEIWRERGAYVTSVDISTTEKFSAVVNECKVWSGLVSNKYARSRFYLYAVRGMGAQRKMWTPSTFSYLAAPTTNFLQACLGDKDGKLVVVPRFFDGDGFDFNANELSDDDDDYDDDNYDFPEPSNANDDEEEEELPEGEPALKKIKVEPGLDDDAGGNNNGPVNCSKEMDIITISSTTSEKNVTKNKNNNGRAVGAGMIANTDDSDIVQFVKTSSSPPLTVRALDAHRRRVAVPDQVAPAAHRSTSAALKAVEHRMLQGPTIAPIQQENEEVSAEHQLLNEDLLSELAGAAENIATTTQPPTTTALLPPQEDCFTAYTQRESREEVSNCSTAQSALPPDLLSGQQHALSSTLTPLLTQQLQQWEQLRQWQQWQQWMQWQWQQQLQHQHQHQHTADSALPVPCHQTTTIAPGSPPFEPACVTPGGDVKVSERTASGGQEEAKITQEQEELQAMPEELCEVKVYERAASGGQEEAKITQEQEEQEELQPMPEELCEVTAEAAKNNENTEEKTSEGGQGEEQDRESEKEKKKKKSHASSVVVVTTKRIPIPNPKYL